MVVAYVQDNPGITVNYPLVMALIYAPLVACVGRRGAAIMTQRWRVAGIWCAAWLVSTALTAAAFFAYDVHEQPWLDQEYYASIGWWLILWNGLYVLSWLALLTAPLVWLVAISTPPSKDAP